MIKNEAMYNLTKSTVYSLRKELEKGVQIGMDTIERLEAQIAEYEKANTCFTWTQVELAFRRTIIDYPSTTEESDWILNEFPRMLAYFKDQLDKSEV